jgi:hypothetical protein
MKKLAMMLLLIAAASRADAIPLRDYITHLDALRAALHDGRLADAQARAHALAGATVESPSGNFAADGSLLEAVEANRAGMETRLGVTAAALRATVPAPAAGADAKLLERLRQQEAGGELQAGGEVPQLPTSQQTMLERIAAAIERAYHWLTDVFEKIYDWLRQFWPSSPQESGEPSSLSSRAVVISLVIAIAAVIGILAWEVMRRSKRNVAAIDATSEPVDSMRDENPLSRGAGEWEKYAAQLAAAGRIREAIRAWYHAVLVTCYGAGILHYRKGRTNWEYVGAVAPSLPWRGDFVALTRRFETEWYGRATSTRDALDDCAGRAQNILDSLHRAGGAAA